MADRITKEHRSWNMSRIRSKDTSPEKRVRSFLHRAGFRFRLHVKNLPGSPDIVLPKYRTAIFVHGCYWHRHSGCKQGSYFPKDPRQGADFWNDKFDKNIQRDKKNIRLLEEMGWKAIVIWECQTKDKKILQDLIRSISL